MVDQPLRAHRVDQSDGHPDGDAGHGAEHQGEQDEEPGVTLQVRQVGIIVPAPRPDLGEHQVQPAADGEVGHEHVDDGDHADEHAVGYKWLPYGVIHGHLVRV